MARTVRQLSRTDSLAGIMASPRTCIPNNEDNDKSTRRIRPRMCAEYPMHNIASLSVPTVLPVYVRTSDFARAPDNQITQERIGLRSIYQRCHFLREAITHKSCGLVGDFEETVIMGQIVAYAMEQLRM